MPTSKSSSSRHSPREDKTVEVNVAAYDIQPDDEIIQVNDATAMGSKSAVASAGSVPSVSAGSSGGSVASIASFVGQVSLAAQASLGSITGAGSLGSTAAIVSAASLASRASAPSIGSTEGISRASVASRSAVASAGSLSGPVRLTMLPIGVATPLTVIKADSLANVLLQPADAALLNGQSRRDLSTQHEPDFIAPGKSNFSVK